MVTLIDSNVSATIRHSDNEPTASVAATAWINRGEATGAERPLKPVASPDNRIITAHPSRPGRITRTLKASERTGRIAAEPNQKMVKPRRNVSFCSQSILPIRVLRLGGNPGRVAGIRVGTPIHGHEAGGLFYAPQPGADGGERVKIEIALIGDVGITI
jgi:hypothetical protein